MYFGKFIDKYYNFSVGNYNKLYDIIFKAYIRRGKWLFSQIKKVSYIVLISVL